MYPDLVLEDSPETEKIAVSRKPKVNIIWNMVGGAGHALQICQVFLKQRYYFETKSKL